MKFYLQQSDNPIYLIELLAALIALKVWGRRFQQRFVVSFVDNEASRAALIKAWSDVPAANNILRLYVDDEMEHGWKPWFGRVPSHSNPADDPSRLIIDGLLKLNVELLNALFLTGSLFYQDWLATHTVLKWGECGCATSVMCGVWSLAKTNIR